MVMGCARPDLDRRVDPGPIRLPRTLWDRGCLRLVLPFMRRDSIANIASRVPHSPPMRADNDRRCGCRSRWPGAKLRWSSTPCRALRTTVDGLTVHLSPWRDDRRADRGRRRINCRCARGHAISAVEIAQGVEAGQAAANTASGVTGLSCSFNLVSICLRFLSPSSFSFFAFVAVFLLTPI
jgi:hypothetical protein